MKVRIEEGVLTLKVKLSDLDLKEIAEGTIVIKARELESGDGEFDYLGVFRLNVEVCKEQ